MNYTVHPSSPTSLSSNSSSGSSPSRDNSLRLPTDNELRKEGTDSIIQRLHYAQGEHKKLLIDKSRCVRDVNKKLQIQLLEARGIRDINQRLMQEKENLFKEKEELVGMCCFLDDDREKAKRVAREWQMFGRYCTGVLQKELSICQNQIRELEQKQSIVIHENNNLKVLCLLLDQEQPGSRSSMNNQNSLPCPQNGLLTAAGTRDAGDGSSNDSSAASNYSPDHRQTSSLAKENSHCTEPSHGENYLCYLEHKVRHLQEESKTIVKQASVPLSTSANRSPPLPVASQPFIPPGKLERKYFSSSVLPTRRSHSSENITYIHGRIPSSHHLSGSENDVSIFGACSSSPHKSQAIVSAMKGLELHDQLVQPSRRKVLRYSQDLDPTILDDKEKAMVREMCNVVWRKLGDKAEKINAKSSVPRTASVSNL